MKRLSVLFTVILMVIGLLACRVQVEPDNSGLIDQEQNSEQVTENSPSDEKSNSDEKNSSDKNSGSKGSKDSDTSKDSNSSSVTNNTGSNTKTDSNETTESGNKSNSEDTSNTGNTNNSDDATNSGNSANSDDSTSSGNTNDSNDTTSSEEINNFDFTETDLGEWKNSVRIPASSFSTMKSGDYVSITTISNSSYGDKQLQVCYDSEPDDVPIGKKGSLSDSTYLDEWNCYTLKNGNQTTKFFPSETEINGLRTSGLVINGKGVIVTALKIVIVPPVSDSDDSEDTTPPVLVSPTEGDTVSRTIHDCNITPSDLGDAWDWGKRVQLDSFHFADMEAGDYFVITTAPSETSAADQDPVLKISASVNYSCQVIGNADSCTNIKSYSTEYETYTLKTANQSTRFTPTAEEAELISKNGIIIQGAGVTVTSVVVYTRDYSAENPNATGDSTVSVTSTLSDPYATNNAKYLYNYIKANYGNKVITGQMENAWDNTFKQLDKVYEDVGKYPALMGFDFMDYTIDWAIESNFNVQTERAINFWNGKDYRGRKISDSNGIVSFCWHWKDPMKETTNESYKPEELDFRIPYNLSSDTWKTATAEYKAMMRDLDLIAAELLRLQEAGVPVIWRPLHEGAGNLGKYNGGTAWFWWGAGTSKSDASNEDNCAKAYIALWKMMYNYFTDDKGIHNLIWLWNGQNTKFYPGDDYVDMIGDDIYKQKDNSSQSAEFNKYQAVNSSLPVALSECGTVPTLENMKKDGAMWSFFMIWNDASTTAGGSDNFWNSENHNPKSHKLEIYNSTLAITLDDVGKITR